MISISHVSQKLVQENHFFNKLTASSTLQKVDCCFDHFQCYLMQLHDVANVLY